MHWLAHMHMCTGSVYVWGPVEHDIKMLDTALTRCWHAGNHAAQRTTPLPLWPSPRRSQSCRRAGRSISQQEASSSSLGVSNQRGVVRPRRSTRSPCSDIGVSRRTHVTVQLEQRRIGLAASASVYFEHLSSGRGNHQASAKRLD